MLNPTQETAVVEDVEAATLTPEDEEHVSADRSIVGPYTVEIPEPRD